MKYILILVSVGLILGVTVFFNNTEQINGTNEYMSSGGSLDLSGKNLTKTPEYVFSKTNLENLDLSNNLLEGSLQAEIRHLQNLKTLNLSNNNFTGIPAEIGQLQNLEVLNLANNNLTGLPYELGNLSNLKILDLTGNSYSQTDLIKIKESLPKDILIKG